MKRFGQVIRLQPGVLESYKRYHAAVWPEVAAKISACNIRNYSIYHKDGFLFATFEYHGSDFDADMAKMAADPVTQHWWSLVKPLMQPLDDRKEGEFWSGMTEVYHLD